MTIKQAVQQWRVAAEQVAGRSEEVSESLEAIARHHITLLLEEAIRDRLAPPLHEPCLWLVQAGGKRIRALIPALVAGACGGNPETTTPLGLGLELIHTFTLIHDDIMDEATDRRGADPVHVRYGIPTAINCGNALFAVAMEILVEAGGHRAVQMATRSCLKLAAGQQLDLELQGDSLTCDRYEEVIAGKTAPLFELAASLGVRNATMRSRVIREMESWGYNFGMSFQARDDVMDRFNMVGGTILQHKALMYRDRALENLRILPESEWKDRLVKLTRHQVDRRA